MSGTDAKRSVDEDDPLEDFESRAVRFTSKLMIFSSTSAPNFIAMSVLGNPLMRALYVRLGLVTLTPLAYKFSGRMLS